MTHKQIIIDGVDVNKCSYHYEHTRVCLVKMDAAGRYYNCANWHDCDFKKLSQQLKHKEQEHQETQKALAKCWIENGRLKKECEELKEELEAVYDDCKGCSTCNEALYNGNLYAKEYRKLKQTLAEIKEFAEEVYNDEQIKFQTSGVCYEILQKISDLEV